MKIRIGSIIDVSLVDVLFSPSFVIWFSGCNFRCPWCHSKPLVFGQGETTEIRKIVERIEDAAYAIEYVQATGGEPTLQPTGLFELFRKVKELGLKTSLDTNCSNPEILRRLVNEKLIDHLATDLKTDLDPEKYRKVTGIDDGEAVRSILESLAIARNIDFIEIRTTFVPRLARTEDIIKGIEKIRGSLGRRQFFYVLQQFIPFQTIVEKSFLEEKIPCHDDLLKIAEEVKKKTEVKNVYVRSRSGIQAVGQNLSRIEEVRTAFAELPLGE